MEIVINRKCRGAFLDFYFKVILTSRFYLDPKVGDMVGTVCFMNCSLPPASSPPRSLSSSGTIFPTILCCQGNLNLSILPPFPGPRAPSCHRPSSPTAQPPWSISGNCSLVRPFTIRTLSHFVFPAWQSSSSLPNLHCTC